MYILFINSSGKCDIFFLLNLIIIVIKKIVQPMNSTRPNPTHVDLCDGLGWIGLNFFLPIMMDWVKKSYQSDPCTPVEALYNCSKSKCPFI